MMENLEGEEWRCVVGWEGLYQVSDMGRVKSLSRRMEMTNKFGSTYTIGYPEKLLKPSKKEGWYLQCVLCRNNKPSYELVHRLVAIAFIPNPNNLPQVNHKDGNKENAKADNLEWVTAGENRQHAYDTGLQRIPKGSERGHSILTDDKVREMRRMYTEEQYGYRSLGVIFGCSPSTVRQIVLRLKNSWSHVA